MEDELSILKIYLQMSNPGNDSSDPHEFEDLLYDFDYGVGAEYEILDENDDVDEVSLEDLDVEDHDNLFSPEIPVASSYSIERISPIIITMPPPDPLDYDFETEVEVFEDHLTPDVHQLYPSPDVEMQDNSDPTPRQYRRNPGPGRPRGRGRGHGGNARGRGGGRAGRRSRARINLASTAPHTWQRGDPIVQVCITDEDVPPALRAMVEDLIRTRAERASGEQHRQQRCRESEHEDQFYDADDGRDATLLRGESFQNFEWSSMDSFNGQRETFTPETTGSTSFYPNIYEAFRSYWDDSILREIVIETNRYASSIECEAFRKDWYDTNIHEILTLFAFWLMLGILKMPTIKSCFTLNPLMKTEVFRSLFTSRRYEHLVRTLHFSNNETKPPNAPKLYCFGRVLEHLNTKFRDNYVPDQNIAIDESLTLWKGLLHFKQYIRTKVARFGIKTFELCDSATGYLWSFLVYTGKSSDNELDSDSSILKSTAVVIKLIRPLLYKGYTVFLDNWFNSPVLARFLKRRGTDCVGTLRSTRKGVPPLLKQAELRRGEYLGRHAGDISILAWQDRKRVLAISTYHGMDQGSVTTGRGTRCSDQWKPKLVLDYNKHMGGVDRKDQMLEPYLMERKRCKKWYMKLFKRLLNCSILNSRILLQSSIGRMVDHLACRLQLVDMIMSNHLPHCPRPRSVQNRNTFTLTRHDTRQIHWPVLLDSRSSGTRLRQRCVVCIREGKKSSKSTFMCEICKVPLCINANNCFKLFHV